MKLNILKTNKDHRGIFAELYKQSFESSTSKLKDVKQISIITIEKGCHRGGHFHEETCEGFILLEGDCEIYLNWSREDEQYDSEVFEGQKRKLKLYERFDIPLKVQHLLVSKNGAKLLILSNKEFDQMNPDTFVL